MIEIVIASKNEGKIREIERIMEGLAIRFLTWRQVEPWPEIEESGRSYVENALIKAVAVSRAANSPALADDSGLEVDALDGLPGVRSARFAGPGATDEQNNVRLASLLHGVPPERRRARYRCVAVLWAPEGLHPRGGSGGDPSRRKNSGSGKAREAGEGGEAFGEDGTEGVMLAETGVCEGWIATEPKGTGGFGYDPWFIPEGETRKMAELTDAEKNAISHRGRAFRGLRRRLEALLAQRT